jgi:hypothetical protein
LPPGKELRWRISRLLHYFSANGIVPEEVNESLVTSFGRKLADESLVQDGRKVYRISILSWNNAVAAAPGWPQLHLTPLTSASANGYVLPWSAFPISFMQASSRM